MLGMMQEMLDRLIGVAGFFWPIASAFAVIAIITKRRKIIGAVRKVRREFLTNLALALTTTVLLAPLIALPSQTFNQLIIAPDSFVAFWEGQHVIVQLIAALLVIEFASYWRHRFEHSALLWRIHATHHADEALHWLTVMRQHPFGVIFSGLLDGILILALGIPIGPAALIGLIRTWWGFFIHADLDWTLGLFGLLFISPAAHRLHHIRDEALMGSNFGNTLTLWDKLFGTYVDPEPYRNCETGIAEGSRGFVGELLRPFEKRYWTRKPNLAPDVASQ